MILICLGINSAGDCSEMAVLGFRSSLLVIIINNNNNGFIATHSYSKNLFTYSTVYII